MKKGFALVGFLMVLFAVLSCGGFSVAAAETDVLTFTVEDGKAKVTDCDTTAQGELVIPSAYEGVPVTAIDDEAFSDCVSLTSITIPDSVVTIGQAAFADCTGLLTVQFSNKLTAIGGWAFQDCTALESVTIPDSVGLIDTYAFSRCENLKSLDLGNGVVTIGNFAFKECSSLESVVISESVTKIGSSAFEDCKNLATIDLPDTALLIGCSAFFNTLAWTDETNWKNGGLYIDGYLIWTSTTIAGSFSIEEGTVGIAASALSKRWNVESVSIPDTVKVIGDYAFQDCEKLASVVIPDSVTHIGSYAFTFCKALKEVTIGKGVTTVGYGGFSNCDALTSITINANITSMDENMFYDCDGLKSVTIPSNCTVVGKRMFGMCDSLRTVVIEDGVQSIGESAFYDCRALVSVTIGQGLKSIGASAFHYTGISTIVLPDSVQSLGSWAFAGCKRLKSITFSANLSKIHRNTFAGCKAFESLRIPGSIKTIGTNAFLGCENLTLVVFEEGVEEIDYQAFEDCRSLATIQIPKSLKKIAEEAFHDCYTLDCVWFSGTEAEAKAVVVEARNYIPVQWYLNACYNAQHTYTDEADHSCNVCGWGELQHFTISRDPFKTTYVQGDALSMEGMTYYYRYNNDMVVKDPQYTVSADMNKVGKQRVYVAYDGCKDYFVITITALGVPTVILSNTTEGVNVSWSEVADADEYVIYRRVGTGSYEKIATTTSLTYTDTGVKPGKAYNYRVCAVNGSYIGKYKTTATITRLGVPTVKTANATKGIKVSWDEVADADEYVIYRRVGTGSYEKIATTTSLTYTDTGVKPGKAYNYRVCAVNGSYIGKYKTTATITRLGVPTVKTANATKGIKVSWGKVSGATSYRVYRRLYSSGKWGSWSKIKTTSSVSYTDTKAKTGKNYQYMVRAVKGDSTGYYKATDTIRRLKAPGSVKLKKATKGFKVTWSKATGATKYEVYRCTGTGKWSKIKTTTKSGYTDKIAKKGEYYTYRVRAVYNESKSVFKTGKKTKR